MLVGLAYASAELNDQGSRHWASFARQNYFDKDGAFVIIFWGGPLLLFAFLLVLCFIREAWLSLIDLKTLQLRQKIERDKRNEQAKLEPKVGDVLRLSRQTDKKKRR